MSSVQVPTAFLIPQSILLKQIDAFCHIDGLGIELNGAVEWYRDIAKASQQVKDTLKPIVDKAKELEQQSNANPDDAELKKQFDESNAQLQELLQKPTPVNIVTLHVTCGFSKPSINDYIILRSLHELKFINCDLFTNNETE